MTIVKTPECVLECKVLPVSALHPERLIHGPLCPHFERKWTPRGADSAGIVPAIDNKAFRPPWYRAPADNPDGYVIFDAYDIIGLWDLPNFNSMALKYILRSGRKPGEPERKDLNKAKEMINRRLAQLDEEDQANDSE